MEQVYSKIMNAPTLDALHTAICDYEQARADEDQRLEMSAWADRYFADLPVFGGEEPESTYGIYSWDADRLLVFLCVAEKWKIVDRNQGAKREE